MKTPPTPARVRLTISVSPEVHETFTRMAAAGSMSVSRAMGDWLGDTLDAATYTTQLMEKARAAPREVMREVHSYALGLADETGELLERVRQKGAAAGRVGHRPARPEAVDPPPCNTGGKVPRKGKQAGGKGA